jgi:hypothetical protein
MLSKLRDYLPLVLLNGLHIARADTTSPPLLDAISSDAQLSSFYSLFNGTGIGGPAFPIQERFNLPSDTQCRIIFAPTNNALEPLISTTLARLAQPINYQLMLALLQTHITDPVPGACSYAPEALLNQTYRAVEGFTLAVSSNGSIVTNTGAPQANLVRLSNGSFDSGVAASNGKIFKIDSLLNPWITYFGEDASVSTTLSEFSSVTPTTMADVLASDPSLTALNGLLRVIAPEFIDRLYLGPVQPSRTNSTTVFIAPDDSTTAEKAVQAMAPFNVDLSRSLLLAGFGEYDAYSRTLRSVYTGKEIAVAGDKVDNARVIKRVKAENGEVWFISRWLDPQY